MKGWCLHGTHCLGNLERCYSHYRQFSKVDWKLPACSVCWQQLLRLHLSLPLCLAISRPTIPKRQSEQIHCTGHIGKFSIGTVIWIKGLKTKLTSHMSQCLSHCRVWRSLKSSPAMPVVRLPSVITRAGSVVSMGEMGISGAKETEGL